MGVVRRPLSGATNGETETWDEEQALNDLWGFLPPPMRGLCAWLRKARTLRLMKEAGSPRTVVPGG